jgi:hypothetical protein
VARSVGDSARAITSSSKGWRRRSSAARRAPRVAAAEGGGLREWSRGGGVREEGGGERREEGGGVRQLGCRHPRNACAGGLAAFCSSCCSSCWSCYSTHRCCKMQMQNGLRHLLEKVLGLPVFNPRNQLVRDDNVIEKLRNAVENIPQERYNQTKKSNSMNMCTINAIIYNGLLFQLCNIEIKVILLW